MNAPSKEKMYTVFEEMFPVHFSRFFTTAEEIEFIDGLKTSTELFVFSGVLRDFLLQYNKEIPRDYDFVVSDLNHETLKIIKKYLIRQNQFNGFKCKINDKDVDIWPLQDTWALKKYKSLYSQDYLPNTSFFNITAAAYSLSNNKLIIHSSFKNFLEDKKHRKLDIVFEDNPYPALCVVKSLELMDKFSLCPSEKLLTYLIRYSKAFSEHDYVSIQMKHYESIKIPAIKDRLKELISKKNIERSKDTEATMLLFDEYESKQKYLQLI